MRNKVIKQYMNDLRSAKWETIHKMMSKFEKEDRFRMRVEANL